MNRLAALAAELVDLWADAEALPPVSAESLCAGHGRQLKAVLDQSRYIIFLCSRRAGKTAAIIFRLLLRCIARRSNCVYIALTKDQARSIIWEPALGIGWKRLIQSIYGDESLHWHNETRMVTTFPNGSVVHFTGRSVSVLTPFSRGPRHCGQLSAFTTVNDTATIASGRRARIMKSGYQKRQR